MQSPEGLSASERVSSGVSRTSHGIQWDVVWDKGEHLSLYRCFGKRLLDFLVAGIATVVTLPLQLLVALLVRVRLGSPIIFRQERPGRGGQTFTIHKFRTMTDQRDSVGELLPNEERMTGFGNLLRSTSMDELPELVDVLRGKMSLVGPRPLKVDYLERYSAEQARRHEVRPGVTGLAQVRGRNALTWEEKFKLDVQYVDSVSLALDLRILWETLWQVVSRNGISTEGHATAPAFLGSDVDGTKLAGAVASQPEKGDHDGN